MRQPAGPGTTVADVLVVTIICFGWFTLGSLQSVQAEFPTDPFSDDMLLAIVFLEGIFAACAIGYLWVRGYDLAQLRPTPTARGCWVGFGLFLAAAAVWWPLWWLASTEPATEPIEQMVAGAHISFLPLILLSVVNGLYEEVFLIGYLQRALETSGALFAIGVTLLVRMLYHLYQGPLGTISVLVFGLILSSYFVWRRELWPVVFAHMVADLTGFSLW